MTLTWRNLCSPGNASYNSPMSVTSWRLGRVGCISVDNGMESEVIDNSIKD